MIKILKNTEENKTILEIKNIEKGCWIDLIKPTEAELKRVISETGADETLLRYALDEEETSHIDTEDDQVLVSFNMPITESNKRGKVYTTMPIGVLVVRDDFVITISNASFKLLDMLNKKKAIVGQICTYKKTRLAFQLLYITSVEFLRYLTYISRDLEVYEENLAKSMNSKELFKLINYQKSMIFFNTAIKTNQAVMERLNRGKLIKVYEEDEDILEDAAIENRQALEMSKTYSDILNGMTEVFGTVVSNNLNDVMKLLASITLIISIPTFIASLFGMNVQFPLPGGLNGFYTILGIMAVTTIIVTVWLKRKDLL